ncbi:hypothetical protein FOCC_FOCC011471, partial [Frankliniella occidentalis]
MLLDELIFFLLAKPACAALSRRRRSARSFSCSVILVLSVRLHRVVVLQFGSVAIMSYNGDSGNMKRQRSDSEGMIRNHRGGNDFYGGDEPVRKRPFRPSRGAPEPRSGNDHERPNHVLLFTILNPVYPITT